VLRVRTGWLAAANALPSDLGLGAGWERSSSRCYDCPLPSPATSILTLAESPRMSFSTPTPRRRAPPRRTVQQVFDLSGSQTSSAAPSLATAASSTAGVFTPRAAVPTAPGGQRTFPGAGPQDEQMMDVATFDGTASVGGSSVFGGSVLSELPDDDAARVRKAGGRPREVWMNDGRVEVWKKGGLPSAVQHALDQSGQSICGSVTRKRLDC
jgi:hypothetical protein